MQEEFDIARVIYLIVLGLAVVFWFVAQNRHKLGTVVQQAMAWGLIFIGVAAAVALWDDIRPGSLYTQKLSDSGDMIELPRQPDGHYYLTATVNGSPIQFVVDTGATDIVLSQADAEAARLDPSGLAYVGRAFTANGEVRTAPVRLDRVEVGPIRDNGVAAVVNAGELDTSLLGMSYLQRYTSIEIADGKLILTR